MTIEEHINGLKGMKPFLQQTMLKADYEGMGKQDAKEIGETIDYAIECIERCKRIDKIGDEAKKLYEEANNIADEWSKCVFDMDNFLIWFMQFYRLAKGANDVSAKSNL